MNTTSEEILSIIINLEYVLKRSDKFDIRLKVLHLINKNEKTNPNLLIEKLGMARSNIAIMCNRLIKENLIVKHREPANKKEIYYTITDEGKDYLLQSYNKADEKLANLKNKKQLHKLADQLSKIV